MFEATSKFVQALVFRTFVIVLAITAPIRYMIFAVISFPFYVLQKGWKIGKSYLDWSIILTYGLLGFSYYSVMIQIVFLREYSFEQFGLFEFKERFDDAWEEYMEVAAELQEETGTTGFVDSFKLGREKQIWRVLNDSLQRRELV